MDFKTKKELDQLSNDKKYGKLAIEMDKNAFQKKLLNGVGEQMMKELSNPPKKLSWIDRLKLKYARWKTLRRDKKQSKRKAH